MKSNLIPPIFLYRIGNFFHRHHLKVLGKFITYCNRILFSVWLPSSCTIGKKFSIGYWGLGSVIHSNARIGDRCLVAQNVTIGKNLADRDVPVIGNDVYIGTGSVIFGEITIGNNVIIGANSVINKSIPDNCTVAGNPFRILKENRQENGGKLKSIPESSSMKKL